jgi:hypothetical protein
MRVENMDNVKDIMSKFKKNLDKIIVDYKNRISEIEKEEEFIQVLGDLVNYSKSDSLLLPFYDETILSRVFERVFPLSTTELNKIKAAKYLIEASKDVDKGHFPQYHDAVKDVESINKKVNKFYEKLLSNDKMKVEKDETILKIEKFSKILSIIGDDKFNGFIDDVDAFEEANNLCDMSKDDINIILNVAIKSNLEYLDSNGILIEDVQDINDMKEQNNVIQDKISDLSNLLGDE